MKFQMNHSDTISEANGLVGTTPTSETLRLRYLINMHTPNDGRSFLPIDDMNLVKMSKTNSESRHSVAQFSVCLVVQGAKRVILGKKIYEYDLSNMVIYSQTVPVATNIIRASEEEPYLCMVINIDPKKIAELMLEIPQRSFDNTQKTPAIFVGQQHPEILGAAIRLLELLEQPSEVEFLAPVIMKEILIRLLRSPIGATIAQIGKSSVNLNKIVKSISHIKENFARQLAIESLAETASMSQSSYHQHFKAITSMSPMQFQKVLRLQQAKHLILSNNLDVGSASLQVGYSSISQFSREYSRFFGNPPSRDISN